MSLVANMLAISMAVALLPGLNVQIMRLSFIILLAIALGLLNTFIKPTPSPDAEIDNTRKSPLYAARFRAHLRQGGPAYLQPITGRNMQIIDPSLQRQQSTSFQL
jgi:hypothetical protein